MTVEFDPLELLDAEVSEDNMDKSEGDVRALLADWVFRDDLRVREDILRLTAGSSDEAVSQHARMVMVVRMDWCNSTQPMYVQGSFGTGTQDKDLICRK